MYSSMDQIKSEECDVEIEEGKSLSIRLIGVGEVKENGYRTVVFRMNGSLREVEIKDKNFSGLIKQVQLADMNDPLSNRCSNTGQSS